MPKRICASMSQEIGLPEGGLLGVSCALEFDGEPSQSQQVGIIESDVCYAIGVCQRIVDEELVRQRRTDAAACSSPDANIVQFDQ